MKKDYCFVYIEIIQNETFWYKIHPQTNDNVLEPLAIHREAPHNPSKATWINLCSNTE